MIFYLGKPGSAEKARVVFPASFSEIKHVLYKLEHYEGGASSVRIQDAEGPAKKLAGYLRHAELEWQIGVDKREGISTGPVEKKRLPVLLDGQEVMAVAPGGTIFLIAETLDSGYPITREREKTLTTTMEQISASVDNLDERVSLSNQRELEAMEQHGPEMPEDIHNQGGMRFE